MELSCASVRDTTSCSGSLLATSAGTPCNRATAWLETLCCKLCCCQAISTAHNSCAVLSMLAALLVALLQHQTQQADLQLLTAMKAVIGCSLSSSGSVVVGG
jgi:hypothetical protein